VLKLYDAGLLIMLNDKHPSSWRVFLSVLAVLNN